MKMASGGSRLRSGPAPDPNALRRDRKDDAAGWTVLPAFSSVSAVPVWPLAGLAPREEDLWAKHWAMPQSVLWLKNGLELQVAMYVRTFVEAEVPGAPTSTRTLLKQLANDLLLTLPAMLAARVRIADDEVAEKRAELKVVSRSSARDRLKALDGGA